MQWGSKPDTLEWDCAYAGAGHAAVLALFSLFQSGLIAAAWSTCCLIRAGSAPRGFWQQQQQHQQQCHYQAYMICQYSKGHMTGQIRQAPFAGAPVVAADAAAAAAAAQRTPAAVSALPSWLTAIQLLWLA